VCNEEEDALSARHCLFHGRDELLEGKWLCQKRELTTIRQMFLERILGIT
jgi:hypothetical protein